jgi:hypothetical protein
VRSEVGKIKDRKSGERRRMRRKGREGRGRRVRKGRKRREEREEGRGRERQEKGTEKEGEGPIQVRNDLPQFVNTDDGLVPPGGGMGIGREGGGPDALTEVGVVVDEVEVPDGGRGDARLLFVHEPTDFWGRGVRRSGREGEERRGHAMEGLATGNIFLYSFPPPSSLQPPAKKKKNLQ